MRDPIYVAVDAIIVSEDNKILLIKRTKEPFKDMYCLPGGHVEKDEFLKDAIKREVKEETGIEIDPVAMMGVYDDPKRDPRYRLISTVYICRPVTQLKKENFKHDKKEILDVELIPLKDVLEEKVKLGFDHLKMIKTYDMIMKLGKK